MSEDLTSISLQIGPSPQQEFRDLVEYSIDANGLSLCDCFSVKVANPFGARTGAINVGDAVNVYASDPRVRGGAKVPLLSGGIITDLDEDSDGDAGTVWNISGADKGWHLVNDCGPLFKGLNGLTFGKMIDAVLHPSWGFGSPSRLDNLQNRRISQGRAAIAAARAPVDTFIPPICFEAGDMIADKLVTYARRAKHLVGVSVDGFLQIYQPDYSTESVGTLHYHKPSESTRKLNNVKRGRIRKNIDGLYTDVVCVGTVVLPEALPDRFNPHAGNFRGKYSDQTILPFRRFLSFSDGDVGVNGPGSDLQQATARAAWKAKRGLFDAWTAEYTYKGHVINGTFFAPDTMIGIDDTIHNVSGNHYVVARRLVRSKGQGTVTMLTLKKPNLLSA